MHTYCYTCVRIYNNTCIPYGYLEATIIICSTFFQDRISQEHSATPWLNHVLLLLQDSEEEGDPEGVQDAGGQVAPGQVGRRGQGQGGEDVHGVFRAPLPKKKRSVGWQDLFFFLQSYI